MQNINRSLRSLYLTMHPAPYRDATLAAIHSRNVIDLEVVFLYDNSDWHPYWEISNKFPFSSIVMHGKGNSDKNNFHSINILQYLHKQKYDVIFISGYRLALMNLALFYCFVTKTPFVFVSDTITNFSDAYWKKFIKYLPLKVLTRSMGAAWVPGRASCEFWLAQGLEEKKIFQGCYCVDTEFQLQKIHNIQPQREILRAELGISQNDLVFLYVGRMIFTRGLPYLLEAFHRLSQKYEYTSLILIGDGPVRPQVEEYIEKYNLRRIKIVDSVSFDKLTEYYVLCDAYIHPSTKEPYSLASAQAAIAARPIIITDQVGAAYDYLIEGETGYQVAAGSSTDLYDAMQQMVCNRDELISMGMRAQKIALKRTTLWAAEQFEYAALMACKQDINIKK